MLAGAPARPAQTVAAPELLGLVRTANGGVALLRFGAGRARPLRLLETRSGWTLIAVGAAEARLEAPGGAIVDVSFAAAPVDSAPGAAGQEPGGTVRSDHAFMGGEEPEPSTPAEPDPEWTGPASAPKPAAGGLRRFSRDDIRLRLTTELPRILTGAAVQPRVRGREIVGLELVGFPMDTVLGEAGLLPGDVLLAVNGREVRGVESLGLLLQRFQTAREVEVTVDRAGDILALRYEIE